MVASFSRCRSVCVLLVAVVSCPRMMDTIVVFSIWASNMLKIRSWMTHVPVVGVWAWLRSTLAFPFWKDWPPSAVIRSGLSGSSRGPPAGALGDLRVTVRASPPGTSPQTSYSSRSERSIHFYTITTIDSVWHGNASNQDSKALQRVVRLAERTSGSVLPSLQDIYLKCCKSRAFKIIKDSNHPGNHLFMLLPSGKRFRSMMTKNWET